jgi:hypothetical protein
MEGFRSIFEEAFKLCKSNKETDKYLMTFQNFLSRVPKWNATIIQNETSRIKDKSTCGYLEDLITCVHIIQLKSMTSMRVGTKQKKIDIKVPELSEFIHRIYINAARKLYSNVYIFEIGIPPLNVQKNNREFEVIVKECICNTIRESIPIEDMLKLYMDESVEDVLEVNEKEEIVHQEPIVSKEASNESARRKRSGVGRRRGESASAAAAAVAGTYSRDPGIASRDISDDLAGSAATAAAASGKVSFGENQVKSFEPEFDEHLQSFDVGDIDNDDDDRLKIGADVNLDIMDIHSLNEDQRISAPPLLDNIVVL